MPLLPKGHQVVQNSNQNKTLFQMCYSLTRKTLRWPSSHIGLLFLICTTSYFLFWSKNIIDVSDVAKNSLLYFSFDAVYGYGYFTRSVLKCYTTLLVKTFDTLRHPFAQVA